MSLYDPTQLNLPSFNSGGFSASPVSAASPATMAQSLAAIGAPNTMVPQIAGYDAGITAPAIPGVIPGGDPVQPLNLNGNGGFFSDMNFADTASLALNGLNTIGQLWSAFQANSLAKKQFNFTKDITERNLANQTQSYNTALEDRIRSRAVTEGRDSGYADSYLKKHSLPSGG